MWIFPLIQFFSLSLSLLPYDQLVGSEGGQNFKEKTPGGRILSWLHHIEAEIQYTNKIYAFLRWYKTDMFKKIFINTSDIR